MKDFFRSHSVSRLMLVLAVILVALLIFQAGIAVGYRRGVFAYQWNNIYYRGIDDPRSILAPFLRDGDDNAHQPNSASGVIVSVRLPEVMLKNSVSGEEIVTVTPTTTIRMMRGVASTSDLSNGAEVIVMGTPDDNGGVRADFIRILPSGAMTGTTTNY